MFLFFSSKSNFRNSASNPLFFCCCCFKVCFTAGYLTSLICGRRAQTQASVQWRRPQTAGQEQEQTAGQAGGSKIILHLHQRHHQSDRLLLCTETPEHFSVLAVLEQTKTTELYWTIIFKTATLFFHRFPCCYAKAYAKTISEW